MFLGCNYVNRYHKRNNILAWGLLYFHMLQLTGLPLWQVSELFSVLL